MLSIFGLGKTNAKFVSFVNNDMYIWFEKHKFASKLTIRKGNKLLKCNTAL